MADLKAHRTSGGCTMVAPTTPHIGRPCHMKCTPRTHDGPLAGDSQGMHMAHTGHTFGVVLHRSWAGHSQGMERACTWHALGAHRMRTGHTQGMGPGCRGHAQGMDRVCKGPAVHCNSGEGGPSSRCKLGEGGGGSWKTGSKGRTLFVPIARKKWVVNRICQVYV